MVKVARIVGVLAVVLVGGGGVLTAPIAAVPFVMQGLLGGCVYVANRPRGDWEPMSRRSDWVMAGKAGAAATARWRLRRQCLATWPRLPVLSVR